MAGREVSTRAERILRALRALTRGDPTPSEESGNGNMELSETGSAATTQLSGAGENSDFSDRSNLAVLAAILARLPGSVRGDESSGGRASE
jgi:hypothetical protein